MFPCFNQDGKFNNSNKKILIFGTGRYTLNNCLLFYENEIVGYLDNDSAKHGHAFDGKKYLRLRMLMTLTMTMFVF